MISLVKDIAEEASARMLLMQDTQVESYEPVVDPGAGVSEMHARADGRDSDESDTNDSLGEATDEDYMDARDARAGREADVGPNQSNAKTVAEQLIQHKVRLLTAGQRCHDWFLMRIGHITGTAAARVGASFAVSYMPMGMRGRRYMSDAPGC